MYWTKAKSAQDSTLSMTLLWKITKPQLYYRHILAARKPESINTNETNIVINDTVINVTSSNWDQVEDFWNAINLQ